MSHLICIWTSTHSRWSRQSTNKCAARLKFLMLFDVLLFILTVTYPNSRVAMVLAESESPANLGGACWDGNQRWDLKGG